MTQVHVPQGPLEHPIYIATENFVMPTTGDFYVLSKEGLMIHRENAVIKAVLPVDEIGFLQSIKTNIDYKLPKLDCTTFLKSYLFFHIIFKKYTAESILLLTYDFVSNQYQLVCPKQTVNYNYLKYDADPELPKNHLLVGTIHSHCSFEAFHSSIDKPDEGILDGLHIVIGNVDKLFVSISACVVVNGHRNQLNPENCIEGVKSHLNNGVYIFELGDTTSHLDLIDKWEQNVSLFGIEDDNI